MCTMEIITIIKDIFISIAAATTAFVAYKGLQKWQKELNGKANFDTARALIRSTYKLRDEIEYSRSPFIPAGEFPKNYDPLNKTDESRGDAFAHVYSKRWESIVEAIQDFDAYVLEAESLWGTRIKEKTNVLRSCVIELRTAMDAYISNEYSGGEYFKDRDFSKSMRSIVSNTQKDKNELTLKINAAIKEIENEISPHLNRS